MKKQKESKHPSESDAPYLGPRIPVISFQLHDYQYFHTSSNLEQRDKRIIGRERVSNNLTNILNNSKTYSGTYLVTGSRGMGKTSLVNNVLNGFKTSIPIRLKGYIMFLLLSLAVFIYKESLSTYDEMETLKWTVSNIAILTISLIFATLKWYSQHHNSHRKQLNLTSTPWKNLVCWFHEAKTVKSRFYSALLLGSGPLITLLPVIWFNYHPSAYFIPLLLYFLVTHVDYLVDFEKRYHIIHMDFGDDGISKKLLLAQCASRLLRYFLNLREKTQILRNSLKGITLFILILISQNFVEQNSFIQEFQSQIENGIATNALACEAFHMVDSKVQMVITYLHATIDFRVNSVDYSYSITRLIFPVSIWIILLLITRRRGYYNYAINELSILLNRIKSDEKTANSNTLGKSIFSFSQKVERHFRMADDKEIEQKMIEIIDRLNTTQHRFLIRLDRQLVFIFDELDKISDNRQRHSNEEQDKVTELLKGLKSFFNRSKAKFIFIAGGDMYDATLADASNNREHTTDRIFDKVLNIPSFYSDTSDNRKANISSMTESYVCQFLIKNTSKDKEKYKSLKDYYANFFGEDGSKPSLKIQWDGKDDFGPYHQNLIRIKSLYTLQNFITYLSYQSNGSPKKITSLFEDYLFERNDKPEESPSELIIESHGSHEKGIYLKFNEEDQYKFALTAYLINPMLVNKNRYLINFNDKLLVATSFIVDHLFKYHNNAFSSRTLELMPEIIAVNKAPQLRDFIKEMLFHFSQTHLDRIVSGLYDYKFIGKVTNEIKFISKVSDQESADFNFTLDESKEIKRHFKEKLRETRKVYAENNLKNDDYVHSIAYLNIALGDLEYYDQEYENAILYFMDGLQELRYEMKREQKRYLYNFILYVRNSLKLGLCFEKQNNYDSALYAYTSLVHEIMNIRNIDISIFGFKEIVVTRDQLPTFLREQMKIVGGWKLFKAFYPDEHYRKLVNRFTFALNGSKKNYKKFLRKIVPVEFKNFTSRYPDFDISQLHNSELKQSFLLQLLFDSLYQKNGSLTIVMKEDQFYSFQGAHFINKFLRQYEKHNIQFKLREKQFIFDNARLIYQPLIAQLSVIEKNGINSISTKTIEDILTQFNFITKIIPIKSSFLVEVEFLNKIGDVLYFKNGLLVNSLTKKAKTKQQFLTKKGISETLGIEISENQRDNNFPFSSTIFYLVALEIMSEALIRQNTYLETRKYDNSNSDAARYIERYREFKEDFSSKHFRSSYENMLRNVTDYLYKGIASIHFSNPRSQKLNTLANGLSDLGDSFLSTVNSRKFSGRKVIEIIAQCYQLKQVRKLKSESEVYEPKLTKDVVTFEEVIRLYYLSYIIYKKSEKYHKAAFQLTKILTLIDDIIFMSQGLSELLEDESDAEHIDISDLDQTFFNNLEKYVYIPCVENLHRGHQNSIWQEKSKYKNWTGLSEDAETWKINPFNFDDIKERNRTVKNKQASAFIDYEFLKHSDVSLDIREPYLLFDKIRFRLKLEKTPKDYLEFCSTTQLHNLIDISSQLNRIHELFLRGAKLSKYFSYIFHTNGKCEAVKSSAEEIDNAQKILSDAIACYNEILEKLNVFEPTYATPHMYFAFAHYELGKWCEFLYNFISANDSNRLIKSLFDRIGATCNQRELHHLTKEFQWSKAKHHLIASLSTHRGGEKYQKFISKMYYLDDDFNDDHNHFYAAQERLHINMGLISNYWKTIDDYLDLDKDESTESDSADETVFYRGLFQFETYNTDFIS